MDDDEWEEDGEEVFDDEGFEEDWVDDDDEGVDALIEQLFEAISEGNLIQVGALLDQGVDIEARGQNYTALDLASLCGRREVVALLLDRGADINAAENAGCTSIMHAAGRGHLEVVELLHARGANIHLATVYGGTPLSWAARSDKLSVCEFLLSKGADLMAVSNDGNTALSIYGDAHPRLSPETKALRCAALEAAWAAGPHPSQVRRRRWESRGPLLWVLAEHGYRPLQLRAQAIAAAAVGAPLPVVQYSPKEDVFRSEGLVRYIVAFL